MTTILNHTELKYLLIDSLKSYSEDVSYLFGNNPYKFNINNKVMYIFIHNVHDSGIGRTNEDECRLQFAKSPEFIAAKDSGMPVLFLGYFADSNTFTAWNPFTQTERINMRKTVSVYSRFSVVRKASEQGLAVYVDSNRQAVISFRPEYLGLYLENFAIMHQSTESELLQLIRKSDEIQETEKEVGPTIKIEKKRFTVTHKRLKRDIMFRKIVSEAYGHRCAVCGIQLELTEVAHIIPFSHDSGTDDPTNGVCLCALHHKAFDSGLIYFDGDYNIRINNSKIDYLTKVHRDGGTQKFIRLQNEKMSLPLSRVHYPSKDFIKMANSVRGIPD